MQRLWLSHDVTGSLASGTPLGVALARPGQNARLTFTGTAGALLALQVRAVATSPPGQGLFVLVRQPSNSSLVYTHLTGAGQTLVTPPLPVTGTYTVFIEPESAAQGRGHRDDGGPARPGTARSPSTVRHRIWPSVSQADRRACCSREPRARTSGSASAASR